MQSIPKNHPRPLLTYAIIASCVAAFVLQGFAPDQTFSLGALWPIGEYFRLWQLLTYAFLHVDPAHLVFNMLGIYMFGADLERVYGPRRLALLYFASVVAAAVTQLAFGLYTGSPSHTIGASGGLFGLLLAFAMTFPKRTIVPLIPPIPMPAWLFVTLYAAVELYLGVTGTFEGIAHFAHLGGLVGGLGVLMFWRAQQARGIRRGGD